MKKELILTTISLALLSGCTKSDHNHVDENHDHICDLCNEKLSDHFDNNNDHLCDVCNYKLSEHRDENLDGVCDICQQDMNYDYAEWPTNEIQGLVKTVTGFNTVVPAYSRADEIEIYTDELVSQGYFGIFCYTENQNSENEYKQILKDAKWDVSETKENDYYQAYDKDLTVWINFEYNTQYTDLEIYVTMCEKTNWPEKEIENALKKIAPGTKTTIPEFGAYSVQVNYYSQYNVLAINGVGYSENIINEYTLALQKESWSVSFDDSIDEYVAISKDKDVKIQFYIEEDKQIFNVDVFSYTPPVENWPYEEIAAVVKDMGATGEILPFLGSFSGVTVDLDWGDPAIIVDVPAGSEVASANAYNQMLVSKGYVIADEQYLFEDIYVLPGTDLGYRGVYLNNGHNFTIEMCKLSKIAE